jgi:hypothetical protein
MSSRATSDSRRGKPRPTCEKSTLLNETENAFILQNLRNRQISQATAVVELLEAHSHNSREWKRRGTGAICFVKDSSRRSYYLNFFHIVQEKQEPKWEQEIYESINVNKQRPFFLQFSASDRQIGLNFADQGEATKVFELIKEKSRPKNQKRSGLTVKPLGENNSTPMISATQPGYQSQKPKDEKPKRALTKADISGPSNFQHIQGASLKGGFTNNQSSIDDDELKRLLVDMSLYKSDKEFSKMMNNQQARADIYDYVEKIGGFERARKSIRPNAPPVSESINSISFI